MGKTTWRVWIENDAETGLTKVDKEEIGRMLDSAFRTCYVLRMAKNPPPYMSTVDEE